MKHYVIGVDYGTDSVRALLVDALTGKELASAVCIYPRWHRQLYCNPSIAQFRQHPLDYIEGLETVVKHIVEKVPEAREYVRAVSIDTTGSTIVAVDEEGMPLALSPAFQDNPNAMFVLWKDHTAISEAEEINAHAHTVSLTDYTCYSGGAYSAEWLWAKALHILRTDTALAPHIASFVEHSDWIPALLTGKTHMDILPRNRCAAGHKAMWHDSWNGYPPADFFAPMSAQLAKIASRFPHHTVTADIPVGYLTPEWAQRLHLSTSVLIGAGALDAHFGAVGGEIAPEWLVKVMGTSTCDMMVMPYEASKEYVVQGICGQVDGSVIPGMLGLEAGQSAFGDIFAWFKKLLLWADQGEAKMTHSLLERLGEEAAKVETDLVALDWLNGRRTPYANQNLTGVIAGLTLGTTAPEIYRSLVEATAFGAKAIVESVQPQGVTIRGIKALGGVAQKSAFVMQVLADVLQMPIQVVKSKETCALGACMFAAVVANIYPDVLEAQRCLGQGMAQEYLPNANHRARYDRLYESYCRLGSFVENGWEDKVYQYMP